MRRPVLLIFTKNTCIFVLQISCINMGYGWSCNAISFECAYSQQK